jgi:hypothetical protein
MRSPWRAFIVPHAHHALAPTSSAANDVHDRAVSALLADYIGLYTRESLPRWRSLFLPGFVACAPDEHGGVTTWNLDAFYERQRAAFATGKPIAETLEDTRVERDDRIASVRSAFVWTDGTVSRRGRLMLLAVDDAGTFKVQALAFSYVG